MDSQLSVVFCILLNLIPGILCMHIASNKGRHRIGWLFIGLIFGILGLILVVVLPADQGIVDKEAFERGEMKQSPFCAEWIKYGAIKCRYCGSELT